MNVLLTSVGRRGYLVDYFRDALRGSGKVIATNSTPDASGMYAADEAIVVPGSHERNYVDALETICREHHVGLLCSLHDLDTFAIAKHLDRLSGTGAFPVIPSAEWGKLCLDKLDCGRLLVQKGFQVPYTCSTLGEAEIAVAEGKMQFPLIIKSRLGFGSAGMHLCHDLTELRIWHDYVSRELCRSVAQQFYPLPADAMVLIQEAISGEEYCIGLVNDLQGIYTAHFACQIHAMRAGESDSATTISSAIFGDMPRQLSLLTQHPGIWGVDVIVRDGTSYIIDINPRFTGDYPFHHLAGANIPAALIAWARGELPEKRWLQPATDIRGYKNLVPRRTPNAATS